MQLIHGNNKTAVLSRISGRAMAIVRLGADTDLNDPTDINSNEPEEIAMAHELASAWLRGEQIEAWHLPGVSRLYV